MISGRLARTASRTFSSWRSQSRAPREKRSYHFAAPAFSPCPLPPSIAYSYSFSEARATPLLLGEQGRDVAQGFLGTVLVVAVLAHQSLLHDRNLLARVLVRARGGSHQAQH